MGVVKPLQMVHNVAVCLVFNQPKRFYTTPLLIKLHWLPVAASIKFESLNLNYRDLAGSAASEQDHLVRTHATATGTAVQTIVIACSPMVEPPPQLSEQG